MSVATERAEGPILDVVLDGALLGVSAVYPSQRAGIWRFVREWTRELASRDDVRLHLVSSGRALWNELALEQTRSRDPFFSEVAHQWHPRPGTVPLWRRVQSAAADWAFRHASGASPTTLAGFLRALQPGLGQIPSLPNGSVYHSPYHALPGSRRIHGAKMRSITIHDMIPVLFPEWFENTDPFRNAVASIGPDDHVFADSANTRGDVVRLGAIAPDHVHVAYPGIGPGFRPHDRGWCRSELARLGIAPVRFLLAVGTLEPRKNLARAVEETLHHEVAHHLGISDARLTELKRDGSDHR